MEDRETWGKKRQSREPRPSSPAPSESPEAARESWRRPPGRERVLRQAALVLEKAPTQTGTRTRVASPTADPLRGRTQAGAPKQ